MKFKIFKFQSVTSTNDKALNLIKEEKKESGYVYAEEQTKGRGTHGRKWISDEGNLFGSLFFPLEDNYPAFHEFSIINPLILSSVIGNYCEKQNISFKWPNDVLVKGRKICGILQELISSGNKKFLIIGIGINIVSNPNINNGYHATNIFLETKKKPTIKEIINLIIYSYETFFLELNSYNYTDFKKKVDLMSVN